MSFFDKEEYTFDDIQALIDGGEEESLILDFKAADSLQNTAEKKRELAKDVSAFANSAGGMIVYGLTEENHRAHLPSFIDGNVYSKEWIEQIINGNIFQRLQGVQIFPIRRNGNILETIYVVRIPQSASSPHMTSEKRYYKRFNFQSVHMEEYEVRWAYNQRGRTSLEIIDPIITGGGRMGDAQQLRYVDFHVSFLIKNNGSSIEELYKVELKVHIIVYMSTENARTLDVYTKRREGDTMIFTIPGASPIFQDEQLPICTLNVRANSHSKGHIQNNPVVIKLYYTNGTVERNFDLGVLLAHNGMGVRDLNFI